MTIYVLTETSQARVVHRSASTHLEKAKAAAAERAPSPNWFYYLIYPVELDAPQVEHLDSFRPDR